MPYSIMLDAGHGGKDPGAVFNKRQEKTDTLTLTLTIGQLLQEHGIDVLYTRTTDIYESPYQKAMEANEAKADFFISIHRNSFPKDNIVAGVETLVYNKSGIKLEMAEDINEQLEAIGFKNLGVKERPGLVVLRRTKMPAVLVEVGFINSDIDNNLFDNNFNDIALAIAEGILDTLNLLHDDNSSDNDSDNDDQGKPDSNAPSEDDHTSGSSPDGNDTDGDDTDGNNSDDNKPDCPDHPADSEPPVKPVIPLPPRYTIQTGAFKNKANAEKLKKELIHLGFPADISEKNGLYHVVVGIFPCIDSAADTERLLRCAGYHTIIISC